MIGGGAVGISQNQSAAENVVQHLILKKYTGGYLSRQVVFRFT